METNAPRYKELLAQRAALEQQIAEVQAIEREDVIDEILEKMALFGIAPSDLGSTDGRKTRKKLGPAEAKYRDPKTGATWTGRGSSPLWMVGQDPAQFLIDNSLAGC